MNCPNCSTAGLTRMLVEREEFRSILEHWVAWEGRAPERECYAAILSDARLLIARIEGGK